MLAGYHVRVLQHSSLGVRMGDRRGEGGGGVGCISPPGETAEGRERLGMVLRETYCEGIKIREAESHVGRGHGHGVRVYNVYKYVVSRK